MTEYTDRPGMPEDERMTDAEFKVVREYLGLTGDWLADHLGVSARTVRHWEQGKYPIPDGVRLAIEGLEQETAEFVGAIVDALRDHPDPDLTMITYRSDADYRTAHPELDWPASWHRAVIGRVAQEVPALAIVYANTTDNARHKEAPMRAEAEYGILTDYTTGEEIRPATADEHARSLAAGETGAFDLEGQIVFVAGGPEQAAT